MTCGAASVALTHKMGKMLIDMKKRNVKKYIGQHTKWLLRNESESTNVK